jgi:hypothetical protein
MKNLILIYILIKFSILTTFAQCIAGSVQIQLDQYPNETSWSIKNNSGTVLFSGGGYSGQVNQLINVPICLTSGQNYTFVINDIYGDGICCNYGQGYYNVKDNNNNILITGGQFGSSETKPFCFLCTTNPPTPTCTDGIQNGSETGIDCGGSCPACPTSGGGGACVNVNLEIKTDQYPSETTWSITNSSGSVVFSGGPYSSTHSIVNIPVCLLQNTSYTFKINDAYGDGICCSYGQGYYKLLYNSTILAEGGAFGGNESKPICINCGNASPPSGLVGNRNIAFVHGIGGNEQSWSTVTAIHHKTFIGSAVCPLGSSSSPTISWQPRKTHGGTFAYSQVNIEDAKANASNKAEAFFLQSRQAEGLSGFNPQNDFIVAHSQGGVVSRYWDRAIDLSGTTRPFGGIITIGTPHSGARIVNSIENGLADTLFNRACRAFSSEKLSGLPSVFHLFGISLSLQQVSNKICDVIAPSLLPLFGKNLLQPIRDFYKDGSTELANLNQHQHLNIAKIAAYGVENTPGLWKTITSFNSFANNSNSQQCFSADNDTELQNNVQNNIDQLQIRVDSLQDCVDRLGFLFDATRNKLKLAREALQFWQTANTQWEVMIGARTYYTTTFQNQCLIKNFQFGNLMSQSYQNVSTPGQCSNYEFYTSTNWTTSEPVYSTFWDPVVQNNDGVVTEASQKAFPGAYHILMDGSNHIQMRNDSRTKNVLNTAYNAFGNNSNLLYFKTDIR